MDFTSDARDDLAAIGEWIARADPGRAASFVGELITCAEQIGDLPNGYPEVDGLRFPGLRRRNHGTYRIYYRVTGHRIEVLNIHHGRRATPETFG